MQYLNYPLGLIYRLKDIFCVFPPSREILFKIHPRVNVLLSLPLIYDRATFLYSTSIVFNNNVSIIDGIPYNYFIFPNIIYNNLYSYCTDNRYVAINRMQTKHKTLQEK